MIGSGPTAPDASTFAEALGILDRFDLRQRAPASVRERLERGARGEIGETPKPDDSIFGRVVNVVIGNNQLVVDAAASRAAALGLAPHVLTRSLHGEARDAARELVALGRRDRGGPRAGGAARLPDRGRRDHGDGARRRHRRALPGVRPRRRPRARGRGTAWWCSPRAPTAATVPPTPRGPSPTASSASRARHKGLDPRAHLDRNDSNRVFAALGDLVVTGPTNTNLLDLYLVLVG